MKPTVVQAVRNLHSWDLTCWVEEYPTLGLWGWVKRKLGLHRKVFFNKCKCGCYLRCTGWKALGSFCRPCYDICSIAVAHPNYKSPVLYSDLR